jgi:hypothetical protein
MEFATVFRRRLPDYAKMEAKLGKATNDDFSTNP